MRAMWVLTVPIESVGDAIQEVELPLGEFLELLAANAMDAVVTIEPELAGAVLQRVQDDVLGKSSGRGVAGDSAILKSVEPFVRGEPDGPIAVGQNGRDHVAGQAVALRQACRLVVLEVEKTVFRTADPEIAGGVPEDAHEVQNLLTRRVDSSPFPDPILEGKYSAVVTRKPKRALAVALRR
jgi:hypothetical protein